MRQQFAELVPFPIDVSEEQFFLTYPPSFALPVVSPKRVCTNGGVYAVSVLKGTTIQVEKDLRQGGESPEKQEIHVDTEGRIDQAAVIPYHGGRTFLIVCRVEREHDWRFLALVRPDPPPDGISHCGPGEYGVIFDSVTRRNILSVSTPSGDTSTIIGLFGNRPGTSESQVNDAVLWYNDGSDPPSSGKLYFLNAKLVADTQQPTRLDAKKTAP